MLIKKKLNNKKKVNASWIYRVFETGFLFDNIFPTIDLTEIFHDDII